MANGSGSRGPPPQGSRARLARAGGRGGIPQNLTLNGGFTLGLVPLPLTVQTGSCGDFSEEQSRPKGPGSSVWSPDSSAHHRRGVQAAGQAGPEAASLHSAPQLQGRSGDSSQGAPWVLRLLQGPGSGVQAALKVLLQHLACGPRW